MEGKYPAITEQDRLAHKHEEDTIWSKYVYWKLDKSYCLLTPEASPVNFSYGVKGTTLAVTYHVVGPLTWKYPYHNGQVQENLPDRLVPASLYGVQVVRPGYLSAYHGPATQAQDLAACDSGKVYQDHISDTDVDRNATPVGYVGQGHQQSAVFVCPQPECSVAEGLSFFFATLDQWVAHLNTFLVATTPVFKCLVRGCDYSTPAAPDSLDALFHHIIDRHQDVYDNGKWHNLVDLVEQGMKVKPNTQYWPLAHHVGELQRKWL